MLTLNFFLRKSQQEVNTMVKHDANQTCCNMQVHSMCNSYDGGRGVSQIVITTRVRNAWDPP